MYAPHIGTIEAMYCKEYHNSGRERLKSRCQSEEGLVPGKEISLNSDKLPDQLAGETEVKAMMDQEWVWLHLDQDCLIMHTSWFLLNLDLMSRPQRLACGSLDIIICSFSPCDHFDTSPSCLSLCIRNCQGPGSDP